MKYSKVIEGFGYCMAYCKKKKKKQAQRKTV